MFSLNLESDDIQFPHHPSLHLEAQLIKKQCIQLGIKKHILLFSSGTTSTHPKGYGLSIQALIENADAVNRHFNLSSNDIWGLSLPDYHVGGLSILVRAQRSNSPVIRFEKWNPRSWVKNLKENNVTITTIVPTQLFDIISENLNAPPKLKFLIVGGDFLSEKIRSRALELGWPVLKTFGMTEVGSQLASQKYTDGKLEVLDIHQLKSDSHDRLWIKSPSLFSFEFQLKNNLEIKFSKEFFDPDGFFPTQDLGFFNQDGFHHLGRLDDRKKISGRLVSLNELKEKVYEFALKNNYFGQLEVQFNEDPRIGNKIIIFHPPGVSLPPDLLDPFHFEPRQKISFERTELGKLRVIKN